MKSFLIIIGSIIIISMSINLETTLNVIGTVIVYGILIAFVLAGIGATIDTLSIISKNKKYLGKNTKKANSKSNTKHSAVDNLSEEEKLIKLISSKYYLLENQISFYTYYIITAEYVINLLSRKKIFQGDNKFSCTVTTNTVNNLSRYDVDISINYTQGFKVLMAGINPHLENKLNSTELDVLSEIKRIYALIIKPGMSSFEKEKAVHDYLIKTSMYDANGLNSNNISDISHTPYGLLFNHMGVCDAYAETFQIFMYLCGIESYVVIGDTIANTNNGYKHAWNIIKLGKFYYHVDVTFDNPGPMRFGQVDYKYFNKSDVEMEKTHTWEVMQYPFCLDY